LAIGGEHIIRFGTHVIHCRREAAEDLGQSMRQLAQYYWVAKFRGINFVIAPATAFDLAEPAQEEDFRQLVLERVGLLR
jgi:hypothetical protein